MIGEAVGMWASMRESLAAELSRPTRPFKTFSFRERRDGILESAVRQMLDELGYSFTVTPMDDGTRRLVVIGKVR